jgi:predicted PurR-regulated permease PerM
MTIAVVQGGIGGFTFWMLGLPEPCSGGWPWGSFSLFPAVGTGFIWVPASIYLLATGAVWKGVILFLCGFFVISTIDNVIRPILVGRDTQMPDYIVLISTLGGFNLFGFNGFVLGPVIAALFLSVRIFGRGVQDEAENS